MKKVMLLALALGLMTAYGQKEKNGTIYKEHEAITKVNAMQAAWVAGDSAKVASYLHDDFKSYNGSGTNKDAKGGSKANFAGGAKWWNKNVAYLSLSPSGGAYPDALEYKDGQMWVQTWDQLKGVHNETGVKIDVPVHRMYRFKDGLIDMAISYHNEAVYREIGESFEDRKNGTVYNHHDNINSVRRMMHAFEHGDMEKGYSFFSEKARFTNLETPRGESLTMEESKANLKEMMSKFDITSIDVVGYPDYVEYDLRDGRTVYSWWDIRLTRKSDDKKIVMPVMYSHDFNKDGEITRSMAYMSSKWLD
ncbi:nuclear transport factor 2 family protein [Muriicola soli]|uniref:Nuclear transport factor 2 family protein n=1 Tax=Muriicola soli TaxID=2507538 RepID=A0A411ECU0_9FLAO|nr:nuclear transport factor 2 family protein [Muriicola soli]QBA65333.1 nuclear transport factor 2 family protein [Muriicola soli]